MKRLFNKKGFTIVELVIVIAVIAVLAAVLIPTFGGIIDNANESSMLSNARNIYKEYLYENLGTEEVEESLYVKVEGGYVHFLDGQPVKTNNQYIINEIPDDALVLPDNTLAIFKLGENGVANKITTDSKTDLSFSDDGYTLNLTNGVNLYSDCFDALGNSCIKVGKANAAGSFSLEVPEEVVSVIFYVAGYNDKIANIDIVTKSNVAILDGFREDIEVDHQTYFISNVSNEGKYVPIIVDTSEKKVVEFTTIDEGYCCMINTIKYIKEEVAIDVNDDNSSKLAITFNDVSKRTACSTLQQVWQENGITVINDKGTGTNISDQYYNPIRLYKNSKVKIELEEGKLISKVEFLCDNASYADELKKSIGTVASSSGAIVTVQFNNAVDMLHITLLEKVFVKSITITYVEGTLDEQVHTHINTIIEAVTATCTKPGLTEGIYCISCGEVSKEREESTVNHELIHYPAVQATCEEDGNKEYWYCSLCQIKYANETCSLDYPAGEEIEKATGHKYVDGKCETCNSIEARKYIKVSSDQDDWSGTYLIVYEEGSVAFNGSLTNLDSINNNISVTIKDNQIEENDSINEAVFIIEKVEGGYSIKSASGYYIGQTANNNGLRTSSSVGNLINQISFENDGIKIVCKGTSRDNVLRYNSSSGQNRFRYYESGQKPISLYKLSQVAENVTE